MTGMTVCVFVVVLPVITVGQQDLCPFERRLGEELDKIRGESEGRRKAEVQARESERRAFRRQFTDDEWSIKSILEKSQDKVARGLAEATGCPVYGNDTVTLSVTMEEGKLKVVLSLRRCRPSEEERRFTFFWKAAQGVSDFKAISRRWHDEPFVTIPRSQHSAGRRFVEAVLPPFGEK